MSKRRPIGPRHIFVPDTQVKPGVPTEHLQWAARYIASKRPSVITLAGDWFDMHSLSSYDRGKLSGEGARYKDDIAAGNEALRLFDGEIRKHAPRSYSPRKIVTLGNHEARVSRAIDEDPRLEGKLSMDDFAFKELGWVVYPFLQPVMADGVTYVHFCPLGATGRVTSNRYGAPSALAQARRMMRSTVAGHRQGLDVATVETPGRRIRGVIAGSFYRHTEAYLGPMGNSTWMGILVLNDIQQGDFDLCEVSMPYLERRFG